VPRAVLRLAVVGAGIMGANHARVAMGLRDAEVAVVVDPDLERASSLASAVGARAARSVVEVVDDFDAAVVAVPNALHRPVVVELVEAGKHVLVEKPIAPTLDDAEAMVAAAERAGVVLMVGHIERFNPAVLGLDTIVSDIVHVDAARISPFSSRITDDVVLDLMIHDLDIALALVGSPVAEVSAVGRRVRSETIDIASALLLFDNGVTASLTASRVGQTKIREWRVTQRENFVVVDLVRQDVTISRVDHSEFLSADGPRYRQSGVVEIPFLERRGEPLQLELGEFVQCALAGDAPRVDGRAGIAALDLALTVVDKLRR